MITKIVSGGQTGADRAGLDFAIQTGIPHGGWCPKGRKALDGSLSEKYLLEETPSASYLQRTEWNVRDSDATVIFTLSDKLTGGSKRTGEFAEKHNRPWIHLHQGIPDIGVSLKTFIEEHRVDALNVAGSREGKESGSIYEFATEALAITFGAGGKL